MVIVTFTQTLLHSNCECLKMLPFIVTFVRRKSANKTQMKTKKDMKGATNYFAGNIGYEMNRIVSFWCDKKTRRRILNMSTINNVRHILHAFICKTKGNITGIFA